MISHPPPPNVDLNLWSQAMRDGAGAWSDQLESVRHAPEFIEKLWPTLFIMALEERAKGPLLSLCKVLRDTFGDELAQRVPQAFLSASALEKLTAWVSNTELENWPVKFQYTLVALFKSSPQQVPASTWETVFPAGGWGEWGLDVLDSELPKALWYQPQLVQWLKGEEARKVALESLCALPKGWVDNAIRLDLVLTSCPSAHRDAFAQSLSEFWCHENWKRLSEGPLVLSRTLEVYRSLIRTGQNMERTSWPEWWRQRAAQPVEELGFSVGLICLRSAFNNDSGKPPLGVDWNPQIAARWGSALGKSLLETEEQTRTGVQPDHEAALCAVMELERWMTGWGLQTIETAQAFELAMAQDRPNWEALLAYATPSLNSNNVFATMRREWKAIRLERLEIPSASIKARPRM